VAIGQCPVFSLPCNLCYHHFMSGGRQILLVIFFCYMRM